jgi:prepilin-type N-terminal cleavage/methylation domain-containing protein
MKKMNKKGFTLIEMLAVIAIIAVLVAIVIPTVSSATEKAKEAADVANIRSAVATVTTNALSGGEDLEETVKMTQGKAGFVVEVETIGGISADQLTAIEAAEKDTEVVITADAATGLITVKVGDAEAIGPDVAEEE